MREFKTHTLALTIAVLGPLINFWVKPLYGSFIISPYIYWAIALSIYAGVLVPFVSKSLLTLTRLIVLGVTAEDFSSALWSSIFTGKQFLPFCNWYAGYFPFFDVLGQPTPYILIPKWYILALLIYFSLTVLQYRKKISPKLKISI
jgi:dolichyl-phosphate-mannose--protein O-mannosyl transferase